MKREDLPAPMYPASIDDATNVFNAIVANINTYRHSPTQDEIAETTGLPLVRVSIAMGCLRTWQWINYTSATSPIVITRPTEATYTLGKVNKGGSK